MTPAAVPVLLAASRALALRFNVPPVGSGVPNVIVNVSVRSMPLGAIVRFSDAVAAPVAAKLIWLTPTASVASTVTVSGDPRIDLGTRRRRDDSYDRRNRVSHRDRTRGHTARVAGRVERLGAQGQRASCGTRGHRNREARIDARDRRHDLPRLGRRDDTARGEHDALNGRVVGDTAPVKVTVWPGADLRAGSRRQDRRDRRRRVADRSGRSSVRRSGCRRCRARGRGPSRSIPLAVEAGMANANVAATGRDRRSDRRRATADERAFGLERDAVTPTLSLTVARSVTV